MIVYDLHPTTLKLIEMEADSVPDTLVKLWHGPTFPMYVRERQQICAVKYEREVDKFVIIRPIKTKEFIKIAQDENIKHLQDIISEAQSECKQRLDDVIEALGDYSPPWLY